MIVLSEKVHDGYKAAIVIFLDFIQNAYFWNGINHKSLSIYLRKSIRHQHSCNLLSNQRMVHKLNYSLLNGSELIEPVSGIIGRITVVRLGIYSQGPCFGVRFHEDLVRISLAKLNEKIPGLQHPSLRQAQLCWSPLQAVGQFSPWFPVAHSRQNFIFLN